jgi:hypothetical protein
LRAELEVEHVVEALRTGAAAGNEAPKAPFEVGRLRARRDLIEEATTQDLIAIQTREARFVLVVTKHGAVRVERDDAEAELVQLCVSQLIELARVVRATGRGDFAEEFVGHGAVPELANKLTSRQGRA